MTNLTAKQKRKQTINVALLLLSSLLANPSFATDSAHHTSQASKHSTLAVSHGAASTAKIASAVVAIPLIAAGSVMYGAATLSGSAGNALMANAADKGELTVTELTITADPAPQAVMKTHVNNTVKTTKVTTTQKTKTTTTTHIKG
ncbi:MAG: hypothetical protein RPS47_06370 [Colwellia sp.]|jgi:hypothetical protein